MLDFVAISQASEEQAKSDSEAEQKPKGSLEEEKWSLRREEARLRDKRSQIREQRKLKDAAWKKVRACRKAEEQVYRELQARTASGAQKQARDEHWRVLRDQHRALRKERQREDAEWRQQCLNFRERRSQLPIVTSWIAILVIVDNCTRQCLGLPLFVAGSRVTSDMIVEALRVLLLPELLFIISDRGTATHHFQEWLSGSSRGHPYIWGCGIIDEKPQR